MYDEYVRFIEPYSDGYFSGWHGYFVKIPAIYTIGETKEEVMQDLQEVAKEWFAFAKEENIEIPNP